MTSASGAVADLEAPGLSDPQKRRMLGAADAIREKELHDVLGPVSGPGSGIEASLALSQTPAAEGSPSGTRASVVAGAAAAATLAEQTQDAAREVLAAEPLPDADARLASAPPYDVSANAPSAAFRGEGYRYPQRNVFKRILADFAAIPMGIPHWDRSDWLWFGTTVAVAGGMFFPLDNPIDQRFQNWLGATFPNLKPGLWSPFNDIFIFGGLFALSAGTLTYGLLTHQDPYVETFSLMAEALVLAQTLHISTKLLLSRDGPDNGSGHFINGPTLDTFERFPNGAPSGHTATLFALATVVSSYWDNPWLSVGVYTVATGFASALVLDRYHYISDVLWGGSMGVAVGRFVVHHRSSRFRYQDGTPKRISELQITPFVAPLPEGGAAGGASVGGTF